MKIVVVSDIHGVDIWKKIVSDNDDADKFIFIGDYFDSFNITGEKQIHNFKDIIAYKKSNTDKVILLIGNHDWHYIMMGRHYSGFQKGFQYYIREELESATKEGLMQICYIHDNYLFSHAGVTKTWCENNDVDLNNIEQSINDLFTYKPRVFNFTTGKYCDIYGNETSQTPIWVRPKSLLADAVEGYIHVVGHTVKDNIVIYDNVILTDTLQTSCEYIVIEDGVVIIEKIK